MRLFRNSMTFIAGAALGVATGMLAHAQYTSKASVNTALAAVGWPIGDLSRVAVKAPPEYWFPRASTYADELAKSNHEGF
jgi:hypothetical protein